MMPYEKLRHAESLAALLKGAVHAKVSVALQPWKNNNSSEQPSGLHEKIGV
jgi:hypothetical protein